jgi:hypothetical protein
MLLQFTISFVKALKLALLVALLFITASAQTKRGILVREAPMYVQPDTQSARLESVQRGREVAIMDQYKNMLKVITVPDAINGAEMGQGRSVTGWIVDKGLVRDEQPNADRIIFGEAADSEVEASKRGGRKGADRDAFRLYYRLYDHFPRSPLAGEALWRAADIQWQLEKSDVMGRKSAKERDPMMRSQIGTDLMDEVRKKFAGTKWAALASYEKIDNQLCGEWKGSTKCPEKESDIYEDYVKNHPDSPKAAEALYEAAWRQGALVDMYKADNDAKKADQALARAKQLLQRIQNEYAQQGDWPSRAVALQYKLEQGIPTYGVPAE